MDWYQNDGREESGEGRNDSWSRATMSLVRHGGAVLWPGHVGLPMDLGHWCLLMMWLMVEAAGWILKWTGLNYLIRFSQNAAELTGWSFTVQTDNDPQQTEKATQEFLSTRVQYKIFSRNGIFFNGWVSHLTSTQVSMFFTSLRQNWGQKDPQTSSNRRQLQ